MTSTLKGGGGVRKYPNFADKQYIKYRQRGLGVKKSQTFCGCHTWKPPNTHPSSKVEEEFCKQSSLPLSLLCPYTLPSFPCSPNASSRAPSLLKSLKRDSIERQIQFNFDKRREMEKRRGACLTRRSSATQESREKSKSWKQMHVKSRRYQLSTATALVLSILEK